MMKEWTVLVAGLAVAAGTATAENTAPQTPAQPAVAMAESGAPMDPQAVDSGRMLRQLIQSLAAMHKQNKLVPQATLLAQLKRESCQVALPKIRGEKRTLPELYKAVKGSVMIVAGVANKCGNPKCTGYHVNPGTGYMLTESGVMATNYHVLNDNVALSVGAMGPDGRVYAVREVLAANAAEDIAIVQLDGSGFKPLPIAARAEIGEAVSIVAHPDSNFYALSTGIVTGYPIIHNNGKRAQMMHVSAEYCGGASGGPILNGNGELVGMVSSLNCVVKPSLTGDPTPQMVFRWGPPSSAILSLIKPPAKTDPPKE